MKRSIIALVAIATLSGPVFAGPQTFDFKDPKGVNNALFKLDAPLEAISGSASGVSGAVVFDPANPAATTGRIVIDTKTLQVPNSMMRDHMHSEMWMDTAKHPEITFELKTLNRVRSEGDNTTADAAGILTIKGVSKEINARVRLTYLRDKLGLRIPNLQGDLLVIRSDFSLKRSDFGINTDAPQETVSDVIDLTLSIAGAAPRS